MYAHELYSRKKVQRSIFEFLRQLWCICLSIWKFENLILINIQLHYNHLHLDTYIHWYVARFPSQILQKTDILGKLPRIPHGLFSLDWNYEAKKSFTVQNIPRTISFSLSSTPPPYSYYQPQARSMETGRSLKNISWKEIMGKNLAESCGHKLLKICKWKDRLVPNNQA